MLRHRYQRIKQETVAKVGRCVPDVRPTIVCFEVGEWVASNLADCTYNGRCDGA